MRYTLAQLEALPTLSSAQASDLKVETGTRRVWLARTTTDDGEPYDNRVTVEALQDGRWVTTEEYPADES